MISLSEFKVLLGGLAQELNDDEIEALRAMEYQLADSFIEWWLRKHQEISATLEAGKVL